jgi:hypothetical protein
VKRLSPAERARAEWWQRVCEQRQLNAVAEYRARTVEAEVDKAARLRELRLQRNQGASNPEALKSARKN